MKWPKMCSSGDFDMACEEYDSSALKSINVTLLCEVTGKIYVSKLSRSVQTTEILFPNQKYYEMPELNGVPLKSFVDTKKDYRLDSYIYGEIFFYTCVIKNMIEYGR